MKVGLMGFRDQGLDAILGSHGFPTRLSADFVTGNVGRVLTNLAWYWQDFCEVQHICKHNIAKLKRQGKSSWKKLFYSYSLHNCFGEAPPFDPSCEDEEPPSPNSAAFYKLFVSNSGDRNIHGFSSWFPFKKPTKREAFSLNQTKWQKWEELIQAEFPGASGPGGFHCFKGQMVSRFEQEPGGHGNTNTAPAPFSTYRHLEEPGTLSPSFPVTNIVPKK